MGTRQAPTNLWKLPVVLISTFWGWSGRKYFPLPYPYFRRRVCAYLSHFSYSLTAGPGPEGIQGVGGLSNARVWIITKSVPGKYGKCLPVQTQAIPGYTRFSDTCQGIGMIRTRCQWPDFCQLKRLRPAKAEGITQMTKDGRPVFLSEAESVSGNYPGTELWFV